MENREKWTDKAGVKILVTLLMGYVGQTRADTLTISGYDWKESAPETGHPDFVEEKGVKIGYEFNPIHLREDLTYEREANLMLLKYYGCTYFCEEPVTRDSYQVQMDNNLVYEAYRSSRLSFKAYAGIRYLFRITMQEHYLAPQVGLRTRFALTDHDSLTLEAYRPLHIWQHSWYEGEPANLSPKPKVGFKALLTHQINPSYAVSLYGEYSRMGKSDSIYVHNPKSPYPDYWLYQPKITISQIGVELSRNF